MNHPSAFPLRFARSLRNASLGRLLLLVAVSLGGGHSAPAQESSPARRTDGPDLLIVAPDAFRDAAQPLIARRRSEGLAVEVIPSAAAADRLRDQIRQAAVPGKTRFILLLGDCGLGRSNGATDTAWEVPTLHRPAAVTAAWGTTERLPGDTFYGDFDQDGRPDAVVGRIPVDTPAQLSAYITRLVAYEDSNDFGPWRQRVALTAGVGGFGFLADAAIESVTRSMITGSLPAWTRTHVTYASPTSPFNPGLEQFRESVLEQYAKGARFWVYAGHGWVTELDRVPPTPEGRPVLSVDDLDQLRLQGTPPPIALLLACYTGAFDAKEDCLAENMLLAKNGPIAVLAGSRVTLPYGNAAVAGGLIQAVYEQRAPRLGDAWLASLQEMATASDAQPELAKRRAVIDTLASLISPTAADLPGERREHMQLYNLLGDPTLRLRHPEPLAVEAPGKAAEGSEITIRGKLPFAGTLSLAVHRGVGNVPAGTAAERRYHRANETLVTQVQLSLPAGEFATTVSIPAGTTGTLHVAAQLKNADRWAVGADRVLVYTR